MATLAGSVLDDAEVTSRLDAEYRQAHKLDKPRLPFKVCYLLKYIILLFYYQNINKLMCFYFRKKSDQQKNLLYCL